jgi:hypothetical protein
MMSVGTSLSVPLASVELLLSQSPHCDCGFEGHPVERCTIENVRRAARDWMKRASVDRSGMTLFYCCGNGFFHGRDETMLLLEGFGEDEDWTGENVISLHDLFRSMAPSRAHPEIARRQIVARQSG